SELASRSIATVAGGVELLIPAEGLFDVDVERQRTERELDQATKQVARLGHLLDGEFREKAAPETVQRERERLAEQRDRLTALERRGPTLERLGWLVLTWLSITPRPPRTGLAYVGIRVVVYALALLLIVVIYSTKERALLIAPPIGLLCGLATWYLLG